MTGGNLRATVNLLWCIPGVVGGSEEYLVRQLLGLTATATDDVEVTVLCRDDFADAHPELRERCELVTAPAAGGSRFGRIALEHTWLPLRARGADVVHHGGGTQPRFGPGPTVLTLHDLQYLTFPEFFSPAKLRYLRAAVPGSLRAASIVTTPTEYVKRTVVDAYDIDPDRVMVVPHGVDRRTDGHAGLPSRGDEQALCNRYGLGSRRFVVLPAITHPHKGHEFLVELCASKWNDPDLALVFLGGKGLGEEALLAALDRAKLGDRVVRPGRVPAEDRDGLIAAADALVFPSRYEGFGAPVIEAMTLGTPVISSDQAALAEVVGGAGLVAPLDLDAWAPLLDEARARRRELVAAGFERAEAFTTARSGMALAAAYQAAAGRETSGHLRESNNKPMSR